MFHNDSILNVEQIYKKNHFVAMVPILEYSG